MPPRIHLLSSRCVIGPSPIRKQAILPLCIRLSHRYSSTNDKPSEQPTGPNQDVLGHVSEEASAMSEITGEEGPELEQGTPIQEVGHLLDLWTQGATVLTPLGSKT